MSDINNYTIKQIISAEQISDKVKDLAQQIKNDIGNEDNIIFIGLLRGSVIFQADLFREMQLPYANIDFLMVSSYGSEAKTTGNVKIVHDLQEDISGKNVIIVEDIIDTGFTLKKISFLMLSRNPKSLKICTLLNKPSRRKVDIKVDYIGFDIDDFFIVGYGIDFAGYYRSLPYLAKVVFND